MRFVSGWLCSLRIMHNFQLRVEWDLIVFSGLLVLVVGQSHWDLVFWVGYGAFWGIVVEIFWEVLTTLELGGFFGKCNWSFRRIISSAESHSLPNFRVLRSTHTASVTYQLTRLRLCLNFLLNWFFIQPSNQLLLYFPDPRILLFHLLQHFPLI